jgi:CSLREA domain-containing protein
MTRSADSGRPRSRVTSLGFAVLAALWLIPSGLGLAATITVTTVADENGSGPNCSLREAIASANGDADVGGCVGVGAYGADTIVFGSTLILPTIITLTDPAGALTVSSDVTITGPGATELAIDGNNTTGVFFISTGQVVMSDLTIRHGHSGRGAGIYNERGATLALTNCTLSGNSAFGHPPVPNVPVGGGGSGGGIFNGRDAGALTLTNCTLSGNSASYGGGGIAAYGSTTLQNTIVANSLSGGDFATPGPGESPCEINDGSHNLIEDAANSCGLTNGVNDNIVGVDPLLDPAGLKDNDGPTQTIALLPGSQAIDAGDPDVCANPPVNGVDQRGFVRPGAGHALCSIGAYEADAVSPAACVGDCDGAGRATIDEIITLVNIALGTAQASACPHGVPSGADVDVVLIIQAVNVALTGCAG